MNTITRVISGCLGWTGWLGDWAEWSKRHLDGENEAAIIWRRLGGALESCKVFRGKLFYFMAWKNG